MKIENIEVKPMGLSFEPEFHITVEYSYRESCLLPLRFNGYIFLDRYRISFLAEYEFKHGRSDDFSSMSANRNTEKRDRRIFVAPISRLSLSKLEDKRNRDPKGDLKFNLHINFVFIEPLFDQTRYKSATEEFSIPTLANGNSLFRIVTTDLDEEIKISSSDWLHEFSKVFERNKYQVFELPIPESYSVTDDLAKRLNAAIVSLKEMEDAKLAGDWEAVLKESRPVWELVRNKEEINALLRQDELNEETIKSYNSLVESLFNFSAKFIHKESKDKQLMAVNKARKEDAELIYTIAISLINLLSKKFNRFRPS